MRLLIIIPNIVSYRSFLNDLCAEKVANGHEVHVACSPTEQWGRDAVTPEQPGVRFHAIEFARGMNLLHHALAARKLRRLVRTIRPDLIHAHFSAGLFTTALARTREWPMTIGTFHGISFPARRGFEGALIRTAEISAARRFDEICVLTEDDAVRLRKALPSLPVRTLSSAGLGCDLERFAPAPAVQRETHRARLGFTKEHCVFVFVGRFVSFKGYADVVRAFLKLAPDHPNARLLLIGADDSLHETGLSAEDEQAMRACPQIVDVGFQKDVRPHLAASDIMVFPSSREGMPVCLMEALAMGIPAITRDSRGCRDVVRDGRDGFVLRDCNEAHLSQAMKQLANDVRLRERMAAEARAGRERFSRKLFIAAQRKIYAECLASRGDRMARGGSDAPVKVAHVSTVAASLHGLLLNQMSSLGDAGYEICGISTSGPEVRAIEALGIAHFAVSLSRNLSPFQDLVSLWNLWRVMRRERFTIVHTHTPKAGLLGQLAARMAGVPVVVNTVHGFYFHEKMKPGARRFYITFEKIAALCSDRILSQNKEDMETAIHERICTREKIHHLGNGIDLEQFAPECVRAEETTRLRVAHALPEGTPVVGFVGRLAGRRKGFLDFMAAAREISAVHSGTRFLIIGSADTGKPDAVEPSIAADYGIADRCVFAGHRGNAELPAFYSLMDLLVLPSLFEGVPRVVMEAAAMGVPAVVSDVKGNREAIIHESTGLLVPLADVPALTGAILRLLRDPALAAQMGAAGRRLATERFDERVVFARIRAEYEALLKTAPPSRPAVPAAHCA